MRIVVLGAGAMGCLFGGLLQHDGHDVTLVDVNPEQIDAINEEGLLLERDGEALRIRVPAARAAQVAGVPDLLVLFTKTLHSDVALGSVRHLIGDGTTLMSLQNGLGNEEILGRYAPPERIVRGVTTFPADLVRPGHVRSHGSGSTRIMALDGRLTPLLQEVSLVLDRAGLSCEISPDVEVAIWEKVAFNAALNTVTAVTGLRIGPIADSSASRELVGLIAGEIVQVANRKGIGARLEVVLETIEGALAGHREHQPSMLQDMAAGRPTEVGSLNGAVVREAERMGMEVPYTRALLLLVSTLESAHVPVGREE